MSRDTLFGYLCLYPNTRSRLFDNRGVGVVSTVAEELEACRHTPDSLTTDDLDVVEVASAVE